MKKSNEIHTTRDLINKSQIEMNYRYDLEVLKGYCILFILFYHNNIYIFKYGYLGVVVFINISGYISSFKIKQSLFENILTRFKRLSPSYYIFLLSITLYIIKDNTIYEKDVIDLIYAFTYTFNIRLIKSGSDYFLKENKSPFLHLWYVSVIFQLYFILVIYKKIINYEIAYFLTVLLSFLYDFISEVFIKNNSYYYNTLTRVWYYIICVCMKCKFYFYYNLVISLILFLNIYKLYHLFINITVISILSTFTCNNPQPINDSLFINKMMMFFGRISYSLYLYHYIYCSLNNKLFSIAYSLITATIFYYLVENNIRVYGRVYFVIIIICGVLITKKINSILLLKRDDDNIKIVRQGNKESIKLWCSHCHLTVNSFISPRNILLVGDSHLEQWIPAMIPYTKANGIMMHYFYFHIYLDNYVILYNKYFHKKKIQWLLVIFGFLLLYENVNKNNTTTTKIVKMIYYFNSFIPKVMYIEDSPKLKKNNICLQCYEKHNKYCYMIDGTNCSIHRKLIPEMNNTLYISFNDKICSNGICKCMINKIGVYDTASHLSPLFTYRFHKTFNNIFSKTIKIKNSNNSLKVCNFYVYGKYYYRGC